MLRTAADRSSSSNKHESSFEDWIHPSRAQFFSNFCMTNKHIKLPFTELCVIEGKVTTIRQEGVANQLSLCYHSLIIGTM